MEKSEIAKDLKSRLAKRGFRVTASDIKKHFPGFNGILWSIFRLRNIMEIAARLEARGVKVERPAETPYDPDKDPRMTTPVFTADAPATWVEEQAERLKRCGAMYQCPRCGGWNWHGQPCGTC